jgi:hypothetical protein
MNKPDSKNPKLRMKSPRGHAAVLLGLMALLLGSNPGFGEELPLTKYQVEAVFLFNFAKYVDWPASAFTNATAPIRSVTICSMRLMAKQSTAMHSSSSILCPTRT